MIPPPLPLQLQAVWNLIWPQLQADIMANIGNWRTSRHNRTMYRVPPYVINWAALNVPPGVVPGLPNFRIVVTCTPNAGPAPAPPPPQDNNGDWVLSATIAETTLPVGHMFALGGPLPGWRDISNNPVP